MRKYLILVILVTSIIHAQDNAVVTLDVGTPSAKAFKIEGKNVCANKRLKIKHNALVQFQLKNTNPFKYTYQLNSSVLDLFNDTKEDFGNSLEKKLKPKTIDDTNDEEENINVAPLDSITEVIEKSNITTIDIENKLNILEKELQKEKKQINLYKSQFKFSADNKAFVANSTIRGKRLNTINFDLSEAFSKQEQLVENLKQQIASQKIKLEKNKKKKEVLFEQQKVLHERLETFLNERKRLDVFNEKNILEYGIFQIEYYTSQQKDLLKIINRYFVQIKSEDYLDQQDLKIKRAVFLEDAKAITKSINNESYKLKGKLSQKNAKIYNEELARTYSPVLKTINETLHSLFSVKLANYSFPIDLNGKNIDALTLNLKRTTKEEGDATSDEASYNLWVKGGFKVDISAGVFLSTIRDRDYNISEKTNDTGTFQVINETNLGDFDYGFGSVANLSYRTGGWVKPTFSFGAMLTNDQKFQILAGGGLVLGKMARFVLHYGLSVGRAETLQTPFVADGTTAVENLTSDTIPTVEKLQLGHFFGITYNLGKVKSQEK